MLAALAPTAEREGVEPQTLLEELRGAGRLEEVREDLAAREAIDLIASEAKPIPLAQARGAREAVDAREGGEAADGAEGAPQRRGRARPAVDARSLASRGIRQALANKARL